MARVSFQLESHIADAVAEGLRRHGIEVWTAAEAAILQMDDSEILHHCLERARVLVTNDPDFLRLNSQGVQHAGIVYWAQQTKSIGEVVEALTLIYEGLEAEEMVDRLEFL